MQVKGGGQTFTEVPIDDGTAPNWEPRLGYPKLFNFFCGQGRKIYSTPWLGQINNHFEIGNVRAILETTFGDGSYIVVDQTNVLRVSFTGQVTVISTIQFSGLPVQMDENLQNQVGITDGRNFYVFDQNSLGFITMGEEQGFTFKTPISIVVINSIAIVLDLDTGSWAISEPNNMVSFPPLDNVAQISSSLTQASSLESLEDNLYIFGTTGIERWVPNSNNNVYLFPFAKDNNFRADFGSLSINGVQRGFNDIYFLSSKFIPMVINAGTSRPVPIGEEGMAKVIARYPDVTRAECSFYTHEDNFFFHMYFPVSKISWVYSESAKTWSNGDDNIVCSVPRKNVVATTSGIFFLSSDPKYAVTKYRVWQSRRMKNYKGLETYRELLSGVDVQMIQGFEQSSTVEPQQLNLKVSLDSLSFGNDVIAYIGNTGEREALTIWRCNLAAKEFTLNIWYNGTYNLAIDKITAILK